MKWTERNIDLGLLILRLSVGGMMFLHGFYKINNGVGMIEQQIIDLGLPAFFAYGVYMGEVVAPLLIMAGIATRIGAVILAINCVVATLMVHAKDVFSLSSQGGWANELLGLYFFAALALVFTGAGKYALSRKYIWD